MLMIAECLGWTGKESTNPVKSCVAAFLLAHIHEGDTMVVPIRNKSVYVDFGVRKPHAILVGEARTPIMRKEILGARFTGASVFLERGCPKAELRKLAAQNRVFLIDGSLVKGRRTKLGMPKSDLNDVYVIRELAKESPTVFKELTPEERAELTEQIAYAYYCKVTDLGASLKNRQKSFLREFGQEPNELRILIEVVEELKKRSATCFRAYESQAMALGIRGVGPRLLGGILITARPFRFGSLSAHLAYCGLKGTAALSGKYNRHVRGLYHQLGTSIIIQRDPVFYPLYQRIKEDLRRRFPSESPSRIEGRARNRLATF